MIFVAVGDNGRPVPVPLVTGHHDRETDRQATRTWLRPRCGPNIEAAMAEQTYTAAGTAPQTTLRFLAAPTDVNWGGKTHGGTVMRWIDEAAYVCAAGWSAATASPPTPAVSASTGRSRSDTSSRSSPPAAHRTQQHARLGARAIR